MTASLPPKPESPGDESGPVPRGVLLRLAADGELTVRQEADLDRHLAACPEDVHRIRFERDLRSACARAMGGSIAAPAGLKERILARAGAGQQSDGEPGTVAARIHPGGRVETRRSIWRRYSGLMLAAAALPLVVAIGMLAVRGGGARSAAPGNAGATLISSLPLEALARAYKGATNLRETSLELIRDEVMRLIGAPVNELDDLEAAGFQVVGYAPYQLPGGPSAAHIVFRRAASAEDRPGDVRLSVFVQNEHGRYTEGITWKAGGEGSRERIPFLRTWQCDNKVFYAMSNCPRTVEMARKGLHGPDTEEHYLCGQEGDGAP
jgi:hypothetical protein